MKVLVICLVGFSALGFSSQCDFDVPESLCPDQREIGYNLVCTSVEGAFNAAHASKGRRLTKLPRKVKFKDAVELGFLPDADSDPIYAYAHELLEDASFAGYLSINGWVNAEMGVRLQVITRYNEKGQLAAISCTEK